MGTKPQKIVFISDLHIGNDRVEDDFECDKEFLSFLKNLERESGNLELIILGDFFDLWKIEIHSDEQILHIIENHKKLFGRLKKIGKKFTITVMAGNHDHALVYNEKYRHQLKKYNINVSTDQYLKREFSKGNKVFRIIGEHGNQVEPACAFPDFSMPTDSSLSFHVTKLISQKITGITDKKNGPTWIKDMHNVEIELIPYWFLSKYFYYEIGPMFKTIIVPMLILFSFAVPYFIFDVATIFYRPSFLLPVLRFLETNILMRIIIFILYFDMTVVIILFFLSFVKRDFHKKLKNYYGIQSLSEIVLSRENAYHNHAIEALSGVNPYNERADMYISGHTHMVDIKDDLIDKKIYANSGSWDQLMKRIPAGFRLPPVYVPYYALTYIVCSQEDDKVDIQLRQWPKKFTPKLTVLERSMIRKRNIPRPIEQDKLIKQVVLPIR